MWRINDEAEGRIVNATINVLDRVHKQYLTMPGGGDDQKYRI